MAIKDLLKYQDPFRDRSPEDLSEWKRIPGLFRGWEFIEIVADNDAIHFEKHGKTEDGCQLWALYRHEPSMS